MQSSNVSSTEFINDQQNGDDDQNILQNVGNELIQQSNIDLSYKKQKQGEDHQQDNCFPSEQITLANIGGYGQIDGDFSPDKIKQKKKQLFDAKEHQSLMELPQRELQSVYSPSQQQNTPSQNDLSIKLEINPSKRGINSSAHLSIDLKILEDKQKRQSVIRQKLNELHDQSIDYSMKANSNDQQSQIAKFGSQFDRDDTNKFLNQNFAHSNQPQGLSQYNPNSNRNGGNTSFSSQQNNIQGRNSQNHLPHSYNQSNQDGPQNISNLQIERSGMHNILLTPDSHKLGDDGITSSKMRRIKLSQNAFPAILQQKRDRLVLLFLQKLKESTVLLRKPFNLKMRHYSIINDLSFLTTYSTQKNFQHSTYCLKIIGKFINFFSNKLSKLQMIEPNSFFSVLNSLIQSVAIFLLIFGTSISMVFPTGQQFLESFLNGWIAIICICLFSMDIVIHFNINSVQETDEKKVVPAESRQAVAQAYFKETFLLDLATIILLIIDTQIKLQEYSEYLYILRIFIFLKIFSLFLHQKIIYNYLLTKGNYVLVYDFIQIVMVMFTIAHFFSLAWFGMAYKLHKQNDLNNWADQTSLFNDQWYVQYLNSLFWGISILTLLGSYKPNTKHELILSCFAMVVGYIFVTLFFLWIKQIYDQFCKSDQNRDAKESIQMISQYMDKKAVCNSLKTRVLYHIQQESKRKKKQFIEEKENQVFECLPVELRKEISEQSNLNVLSKIEIFNRIFSQKTLDSLLLYIEELNFLPNQVIYQENSVDDQSIYYILDGSVGVYQGEQIKNTNRKYIQTLKKGQVFGEICFFTGNLIRQNYQFIKHEQLLTGQIRQDSMVALEYVKVAKIKREYVLKVIYSHQDDLERFCMLKDSYILYDDIGCLGVNCYSCGKTSHTLKECPMIHPQFDNVKIIHRHIYSAEQIRSNIQRKRIKYSQKKYYITKKAHKVQQRLRDDSECHQKLNELIEQLNIFELDEDYEEEEEIDEDEDYIGNSKTNPEEEDTSQPNEKQDRIREDNYTLKNFSDQEEEGLRQQIMRQSKQSSMNNNANNSGRGDTNNTPNTANNPYTDNSSQLSKQVKSLRKDSSSSQVNGEPIISKEYKKEMTYNTIYTDQQFQGYEYFLQESTSNNNNQNNNTSNNLNSNNNPTVNMVSNNATLNNINTNASMEPRISIPDLAQHLIYEYQPQRIANKKLTTQTAPQIYNRTKSFASRKSKKQSSSPDQLAQSANEKSMLQDLILDPSLCKELTRDFTLNSKKSNKRHLKFADEQILGQMNQLMKSDNTLKNNNNPTSTSIQLSPYQDSISSKESNYQNSIQQSSYIVQQFQSLLLKFQSVFRQINQAQRYNSLAQSLDQMKNCDKDSDILYEINSLKNSIKDIDHRSSSNQTNRKVETSAVLYKQHTSALSRQADEWNLERLKDYKIYFPHNNFSFIYPQIQLIQRNKFKEMQQLLSLPIKISPSIQQIPYQSQNEYLLQNIPAPQNNYPLILNDHQIEPRKTVSTNLTQNRTRKSQYSLTYGVQINSKPFRHFGSLNSGNSSANRINSIQNSMYQKNTKSKRKNHSQSSSEYSYIRKS